LLFIAEGHFDGESIIRNCEELRRAVTALKSPAKARKEALNQSMKFHGFNFDLARELEWIAEKRTILNSTPEIQNLHQVLEHSVAQAKTTFGIVFIAAEILFLHFFLP
jgi:hypothetical protein